MGESVGPPGGTAGTTAGTTAGALCKSAPFRARSGLSGALWTEEEKQARSFAWGGGVLPGARGWRK